MLETSGKYLERRRDRICKETLRMIHNELFRLVREQLETSGQLDNLVADILDRRRDPYSIMREIVDNWINLPKNICK